MSNGKFYLFSLILCWSTWLASGISTVLWRVHWLHGLLKWLQRIALGTGLLGALLGLVLVLSVIYESKDNLPGALALSVPLALPLVLAFRQRRRARTQQQLTR